MEVRLDDIIVTKSGDSNGGDNCNRYGQNAALLVKDGAVVNISNADITSTARGGSGVFSYGGSTSGKGDGTRLDISDSIITTTGKNASGLMTAGGGELNANGLTINTSGESSAPIGSDQGGGDVTVDEGTYVSAGINSPAVLCTATMTVQNSTLVTHCSSGVILKGRHKLNLKDCAVTAKNHNLPYLSEQKCGILVYDPDNQSGVAELTVEGGAINNLEGDVIHITNIDAKVALINVLVNNSDSDDILLSVSNDGWGGAENKATVEFRECDIAGNIVVSKKASSAGNDENSVLDLIVASNSIYTGSINTNTPEEERGSVNLTVRQGSRFVLSDTSYIDSLVNNGRIICGDYDLYVNGEKYDDGGGSHPTEASLTLDGTSYTVKDRYGKIKVEQNARNRSITATIVKSGQFTISGNGENVVIRVASNVKDVILVLSDLTIDNTHYKQVVEKDSSVIIFEPEADGTILLKGTTTLLGPDGYISLPRAIIRGNESNLIIDGTIGELRVVDNMPETTSFSDDYPDCINNYKGHITFKGGTYKLRSNGSALRSTGGVIKVDDAEILVEYAGQDAINTDDGTFNMISGRLDVSEAGLTGISASSIELPGKGEVSISGGEIRLYKIADSGIRGENVFISGGTIDITNIYDQSGDEIYVPGNGVKNKITIFPINELTDRTRVNFKTGYHHGIEVGTRGKQYSYLNVPKTDSTKEPGVIYTQSASGSLSITGGTINIDTRITGLIANIVTHPIGYQPCSNGIYYVGAPGHGIMCYGITSISGGNLTINAGGDGINCDSSVIISQAAKVNIPLCYTGIQAADLMTVATEEDAVMVEITPMGTSVKIISHDYTYTYDDSREEHNNYIMDETRLEDVDNYFNYGAHIITQLNPRREVSVILRSGSRDDYIKKEYTYQASGIGFDVAGYIYVDSGEFDVYGPDLPDRVPLKQTKGICVNKNAIYLVTGVDPQEHCIPRYGDCVYLQPKDAEHWEQGVQLKVDTPEGNPIYRGVLPNSGSFLIFTHPELIAKKIYAITIGDKYYTMRGRTTLNGGSL